MKKTVLKFTRSILSVILAVLMLVSLMPAAATAADTYDVTLNGRGSDSYSVTYELEKKCEYGIRYSCSVTSYGISLFIKDFKTKNYELDLKVYKWDTNYSTSVSKEPVSSGVYDGNLSDRETYFDLVFDTEVPAGEYIVVIVPTGTVPSISLSYSTTRSKFYAKGFMETRAALCNLICASGDTSAVLDIADGFAEPVIPEEYEYPEDSAVVTLGVDSDAWYMVDGLGRTLPTYTEAGEEKERYVAMFYWTWHSAFIGKRAINVNSIITEHPEIKNDYSSSLWPTGSVAFFWDEPVYGYYTTTDSYVIRKQAELMADAGVDVVIFDCTNGTYTWDESFLALCETYEKAREEGVNTPQIAFILNFGANQNTYDELEHLYTEFYAKGLYQDLWFYWDGKPLIMAYGNVCDDSSELSSQMSKFFTFRYPEASYFSSDNEDRWGWLSNYPQPYFGKVGEDGRPEEMTVGVAQNCDGESCTAMNGENIQGRGWSSGEYSYMYKRNGVDFTVSSDIENAYYYGVNFQQQWDRAIECDPDIVFVTGWNEWTAGRAEEWGGVENAFPDEFDDEYSRDIEPSAGELKDYYYTQLCANIRRYKGMSNSVPTMTEKTIDISDLSSWDSVTSTYNHYLNSTYDRNSKGYAGLTYTNDTMRNDISTVKIAYDSDNIYFYAETADSLTPSTDNAWMRLFLDTDQTDTGTNWEGFEYVLNRTSPDGSVCTLEKSLGTDSDGNWLWESAGTANIAVFDKVVVISVSREALGLTDKNFMVNFKWSDNMQTDGDIMDFYVNGDVAPGSRFAFCAVTYKIKDVGTSSVSVPVIIAAVSAVAVIAAAVVVIILVVKKRKNAVKN